MFSNQLRSISLVAIGSFIGFVFGGCALFVMAAWSVPAAAPPNENVPAPINVGADAQSKTGKLTLDRLQLGTKWVLSGNVDTQGHNDSWLRFLGTNGSYYGGVAASNLWAGSKTYTPTLCLNGDCRSAWPEASAALFGGMYQVYACNPGVCRIKNPVTGACSCPTGYAAIHINDFEAPLGAACGSQTFYENNGMILYFCYK